MNPVHPGRVVARVLRNHNLTADDLVGGTSFSPACVQGIIDGEIRIDDQHAQKLADYFDVTPTMWLKAQALYDQECPPQHNKTRPCPAWLKATGFCSAMGTR